MRRERHRFLAVLVTAMMSGLAIAGLKDKVIRFSTPGIDCYADGFSVRDGECYALVWSPTNSVSQGFHGFNADGTTVSADDRVILAAPLALGGRCRDTLFQVPAAEYEALSNGVFSVCLIDSRNRYGVPSGIINNKPCRVNRWGEVTGGVTVSDAGAISTMSAQSTSSTASGDAGVFADVASLLPSGLEAPVITGFDFDGDDVVLTVDGTVPYLTYTIESGESPDAFAGDWSATKRDGSSLAPIELKAEATEASRFFRIKRVER